MSVEREEVERIAALAHLQFDEAELERLTAEMNQILEHADVLRGAAATPAEATSAEVTGGAGPASVSGPEPSVEAPPAGRAGGVPPPDTLAEDFLPRSPHVQDDFFVVPPPPGVDNES